MEKRGGGEKRKKKENLWEEPGAFKEMIRMPTVFKPPFLKRGFFFFFGLKYFTLNELISAVNERMSLIHCGHLLQCKSMPFFTW